MTNLDAFVALATELQSRLSTIDQIAYLPPRGVDLTFTTQATDDDKALAASIVAGWDWSDVAQLKRDRREKKAKAKAQLTADDPTTLANRNALRVVYGSLVELRQAFNALRDYVRDPARNPLPPALPSRTWKQVLGATRSSIDSEADPEN